MTRYCPVFAAIAWAAIVSPAAHAATLEQPAVFRSEHGVLDVVFVVRPLPIASLSFTGPGDVTEIHPVGWVYEVCRRRAAKMTNCNRAPDRVSSYAGVRLALSPGDILKIRLINELPKLDPRKIKYFNVEKDMHLDENPTNLHTHGLLVDPRPPSKADPTVGDYVFIELRSRKVPTSHLDAKGMGGHYLVRSGYIDYRIEIPSSHPPGLFWFHPHIHGISLNQVSAGLSGIITVGEPSAYASTAADVQHLVLRDMQVLSKGQIDYGAGPVAVSDGEVQNQQSTSFCEAIDNSGPLGRLGYCDGAPPEGGTGNSFVGSKWYFTINGQTFPTIRVSSTSGQVWRVTNASAQVSYRLRLIDDSTKLPIKFQVMALDGVPLRVASESAPAIVSAQGGGKFHAGPCRGSPTGVGPVCVDDILLMPGARADLWITYRGADGLPAASPPDATATLIQAAPDLGQAAEPWPQVKLARVEFAEPAPSQTGVVPLAAEAAPEEPVATVHARATPVSMTTDPGDPVRCDSLPVGHRRRIFLGVENPRARDTLFGIGYEEVDASGVPVAGTFRALKPFSGSKPLVCVRLGPGGLTTESWEIVNLSSETHNFHMHQVRFSVTTNLNGASSNTDTSKEAKVLQDSVPVPFASVTEKIATQQGGYCTVDQWRAGSCAATPVRIEIPFALTGDYVFHCHILDHEDGGMMARIRVTGQ